tara:strand:+ start:6075 stop:6380 length:306 start_codon:yes stop_codon:yes gene_type:complete
MGKSPCRLHRFNDGKGRTLSQKGDGERSLVPKPVPARGPCLFQGVENQEPMVRPWSRFWRKCSGFGRPALRLPSFGRARLLVGRTILFFFSPATFCAAIQR